MMIMTLSTVGFGDITPKSNMEKIFCLSFMTLGAGIYSFIVGTLSSMLYDEESLYAIVKQVSSAAGQIQLP